MPYFDQYGTNFSENGGNAARDFERYRQSDEFQRSPPAGWNADGTQGTNPFARLSDWLFGSSKPASIKSEPLPPLPGTTESAGPFGGAPAQPAVQQPSVQPQPKPASQLASASSIVDLINQMLGTPSEPPPPAYPTPTDMQFGSQDMLTANRSPFSSKMGESVPFNVFGMGIPERDRRAPQRVRMYEDGGDVPGFMRGGYPELRTAPVRTFDSGGETYVGGDYGDAGGREDNINARLSPREYVVDAETMALLGDGNPDKGAKKMDEFRSEVRKHKGKALAKGKISPNAKAASSYVRGNPMGDGLRITGLKK